LRGLIARRNYLLTFDAAGEKRQVRGADLMQTLLLSLRQRPSLELITYK